MSTHAEYGGWLDALARQSPSGDRLGTAGLIDPAARLRARDSIASGDRVRLSRPLPAWTDAPPREAPMAVRPAFFCAHRTLTDGTVMGFGIDRLEVACHGYDFTHMDGLNHILMDGALYARADVGDPTCQDIAGLADQCFFTRAVVADVPAVRGTRWIDPDDPVTGADIDRAIGDEVFVPGDALVLYMGRDRFEAAGHVLGTTDQSGAPGDRRPGVGGSGAKWIAEHGVSVLCWDLQDAVHDGEPQHCVHRLIHAAGLAIVDNCELGAAAGLLGRAGRRTAALIVQPVGYPGGTGSVVEPFLVT